MRLAMSTSQLLVLGAGSDPLSERGVSCPGDLPLPSDPSLVRRAERARAELGDRAFVLGHHYQRDEVIAFADVTGDSFKLAREAAARAEAEYVVFCGVHFMAESADILTANSQRVILPDLAAGCSMADMASYSQVEECWETLEDFGLADCVVWNPHRPGGGVDPEALRKATMILWRGHCSVHGRFIADNVTEVRQRIPGVNVIVHPECVHEVVTAADQIGSTEKIIATIEKAAAGSAWAVGTELNLVQRLAQSHQDKTIVFLDKTVCYCSTMNRIDLPHLVWAMESLVSGQVVNQITVDPQTAAEARSALDQMLALP